MENLAIASISIALFLFIMIRVGKFILSSTPQRSEWSQKSYEKELPSGFGYPYFHDHTGYAINVKENKIYLLTKDKIDPKIYDRSQIRNIEYKMEGYDTVTLYGQARMVDRMDTALANRKARYDAYKDSGIFFSVADIDNPRWQVRYTNKEDLNRSFEILRQFMEGTLIPYEDYLAQKSTN